MSVPLLAPFPYFGGKRSVAEDVWVRLGRPKQYIEPFCGSAAMLLAAPEPASLEVVNDMNGFIANFWRAVKNQPDQVAIHADYPVSHIDMGARHGWLMAQRERIGAEMQDPNWPGDAKVAGWWLWGQCSWIGSGWCDWDRASPSRYLRREGRTGDRERDHASNAGRGVQAIGQVPHATSAGRGVQAIGKVPHAGNAGMGVQAIRKVPQYNEGGRGILAIGKRTEADGQLMTSAGRTAWRWLHQLANRLERVRVVHGDWSRCLNNHFGGSDTAVFLDPPYRAYEALYGAREPVADQVATWGAENGDLRIALCGHVGDYDLPGWEAVQWSRGRPTYSGGKTTDSECIWYSPACLPVVKHQGSLFDAMSA